MNTDYRIAQFGSLFSDGADWGPAMSRSERRRHRDTLFRETTVARLRRLSGDVLHLLRRAADLPQAVDFFARSALIGRAGLPMLEDVRSRPDGLADMVNDLSPTALAEGYAAGFFPRWIFGQATWWSPAERMVRKPDGARAAASDQFLFELDRDFESIVAACAQVSRAGEFGLGPMALQSFTALADQGFGHCFAVRNGDGAVVAGGFGVASGRVFATEAVFETEPGALAFGLDALDAHLASWNFQLHDLRSARASALGFRPMLREAFLLVNTACQNGGRLGRWCATQETVTQARNVA